MPVPPLLLETPHLTITDNAPAGWLYADWRGPQNMATVQGGCGELLRLLQGRGYGKVLNDNTRVTTMWSEAAEWAGRDWFPAMEAGGLRHFAWIYPADVFASLSIDLTLQFASGGVVIATFGNRAQAEEWLQAQP